MNTNQIIEEIKSNPRSLVTLQESNKLVKLITKGLVLGKEANNLASELVSDFSASISVEEIIALIEAIKNAVDINSRNPLSNEDIMLAEKIAINILNKDPNAKGSELLKDLKVALALTAFDEILKEIIKNARAKHLVDFESLGIDPRFKPRRKDSYIVDYDDKREAFIVNAPCNSSANGYVLGFSPNKLFFLGHKDGILKQDHTRNQYQVRIIYGLLPGGKMITKLDNKILSKGVPIEEIPDSLAQEIIKRFSNNNDEIILGAAMSGREARRLNGKVQLEKLPFNQMLKHFESRVLVFGRTGDGKTIWTESIARQILNKRNYLQGGMVIIDRDTDKLSNIGNKFMPFEQSTWDDKDGSIVKAFTEEFPLQALPEFKKMIISGDSTLPDINKLSKETVFGMIDRSSCSDQVKTALKRHVEESDDVVDVFEKAKNGQLLSEEYTNAQEDALKRLMNSLIPVNYDRVNKIDLKKELEDNKYVGFFIKGLNADVYGTMIVHELYNIQKNKQVRNPLKEGRLLIVDEIQKYVRFDAFKDVFEMCVLDGRNFGIMILGIIQSKEQATKLCSYKDFVLYEAKALEDGKRIIQIEDRIAVIPPMAPEVI